MSMYSIYCDMKLINKRIKMLFIEFLIINCKSKNFSMMIY